jgi:transcriptional regulator with XRE-family HTH domain
MTTGKFDGDAFFAALDAERTTRRFTWKRVAEDAEVPASTLTRMSQGKRPDVDTLAALCAWAGLSAENFVRIDTGNPRKASPLSQISAHLRADPNLSKESVQALEAIIKAAYEQVRKKTSEP